ncbi:MAG: 23S rRNA (pseudouridine(1915)-N(3))-methyltransferase RlmH [Myxococcales bacterium]|nr:23S rRNA (pseudouridine(1915)-N(3))-methyltransferase RlmH [Myxococcales bacterium]
MKLHVLCVGRLKESYFQAAEDEYLKRLRRYVDAKVVEVKDDAALIAALPARARLIALDSRGETWSSEELAKKLVAEEELRGGGAPIAFLIGGADGLPTELLARAQLKLSFGRITLPHRLARIVLIEQLYRAYTILRGEPYHR